MVPNRAGLWAASDDTPFGFGRSYTAGQLEAQTRKAGFVSGWSGAAVYIPPSDRRFWLRTANMWERTGTKISRVLIAGVVLAELTKQVQGAAGVGSGVHVPNPIEVLGGIARPRPKRQEALRRVTKDLAD